MLFDGGSAWTFLGIWASLAKGDSVKAPAYQQDYMQKLLPGGQNRQNTQNITKQTDGTEDKCSGLHLDLSNLSIRIWAVPLQFLDDF